ncbi:MAG TPA: hypothetical protein ENN40_11105 [Candidatus Aminicenantes bacterium]|nr:hypothetical protein [Candidatus Aminicenantes bacterium]
MNERKPKWLGDSRIKSTEEHIRAIESRIENLKIHYNQFFAGEITAPPEKERETIEMLIRRLLSEEHRSPRINLLVQNLASRFNLFNNRWLKQLHELEVDYHPQKRQSERSAAGGKTISPTTKFQEIDVSLNREDSFEQLFNSYRNMTLNPAISLEAKEKWINSLKAKMISANLVDAKISIAREEGKLKVRVKK